MSEYITANDEKRGRDWVRGTEVGGGGGQRGRRRKRGRRRQRIPDIATFKNGNYIILEEEE